MSRKNHGTASVPIEDCLSGGVHPNPVCQLCARCEQKGQDSSPKMHRLQADQVLSTLSTVCFL